MLPVNAKTVFDPGESAPVAAGMDSEVFIQASKVYKVYSLAPREHIELYRDTTQRAFDTCQYDSITRALRTSHGMVNLSVEIVPFNAIVEDSSGRPVLVQECLDDPEISDWMVENNAGPEIRAFLDEVSIELGRRLGVEGINLGSMNVRVAERGSSLALRVTDICCNLRRLKPTPDSRDLNLAENSF